MEAGPVHANSSCALIPVHQSQGLRVSGGDHEANGWGSQFVPSTVCKLPGLPVVLLKGVAVASRDGALIGADHVGDEGPLVHAIELRHSPIPSVMDWGAIAHVSDSPHDAWLETVERVQH